MNFFINGGGGQYFQVFLAAARPLSYSLGSARGRGLSGQRCDSEYGAILRSMALSLISDLPIDLEVQGGAC